MKEKVLELLHVLGFMPEIVGETGWGYQFEFENNTLLFVPDSEDTLSLTLPAIYDVTPENTAAVKDAMLGLCSSFKFVQPEIVLDKSVWLNYQHYLGENEPTEGLLSHMIRVLAVSGIKFYDLINKTDHDE